jgi:rhodanese-related sulfurtransferase
MEVFMFLFKSKSNKLSKTEIHELMNKKDVTVLDVRTPEEFKGRKIKGSKNLPLNELAKKADKMLKNRDTKILVCCLSGSRSRFAVKMLNNLGFTDVSDIGGIGPWIS